LADTPKEPNQYRNESYSPGKFRCNFAFAFELCQSYHWACEMGSMQCIHASRNFKIRWAHFLANQLHTLGDGKLSSNYTPLRSETVLAKWDNKREFFSGVTPRHQLTRPFKTFMMIGAGHSKIEVI